MFIFLFALRNSVQSCPLGSGLGIRNCFLETRRDTQTAIFVPSLLRRLSGRFRCLASSAPSPLSEDLICLAIRKIPHGSSRCKHYFKKSSFDSLREFGRLGKFGRLGTQVAFAIRRREAKSHVSIAAPCAATTRWVFAHVAFRIIAAHTSPTSMGFCLRCVCGGRGATALPKLQKVLKPTLQHRNNLRCVWFDVTTGKNAGLENTHRVVAAPAAIDT